MSKKINEIREDNNELLEQRRRHEEMFDNENYMAGLGTDQIIHCQFLMNAISYYHSLNHQLREIIEVKNQVNQNEGKKLVLKALLGQHSDDQRSKKPKFSEETGNKDSVTGASGELPSLVELEAMVEAAEAENSRLTNSITTTQVRNKTLETELNKTIELNKVKRLSDIENSIIEKKNEIDEIKAELELLSS